MNDKDLDIQVNEEVSIGIILSRARHAKNISLEKAEEDTRIRTTYLRYLETDEYDKLPGETFVKGMIRNYGNYLGLDGADLVQQYRASHTGQTRGQIANQGIREAESVKMNVQFKNPRDIGSGTGRFEMPNFNFGIVVATVVLLAIIGIGYFTVPKVVAWVNTPREATTQNIVVKDSEKKPETVAENKTEGFIVEIEAIDKCWFEAYGDGREMASTMLYAGDKKKLEAKDRIRLKFGNMSACKVIVNGNPISLEGIKGVHTLDYSRDK